jgi:hypothetical protein
LKITKRNYIEDLITLNFLPKHVILWYLTAFEPKVQLDIFIKILDDALDVPTYEYELLCEHALVFFKNILAQSDSNRTLITTNRTLIRKIAHSFFTRLKYRAQELKDLLF